MTPRSKCLISAVVLVLAGCANKSSVKPASEATGQRADTASNARARTGNDRLTVSDEIAKACNIHFDNPQDAPKFDFDKADLSPQDRDVLSQVAKCVTVGPLRGSALTLVGRADARGEEEYNMALGGTRAAAVRAYLSQLGVDGSRMTTTSRGKLDATGTNEETWRLDRRVDIDLDRRGGTTAAANRPSGG